MIRVRFAPSPTGFLHIGGLRTALYNYLFARHRGGKLILRIEDTDRSRFVEGTAENLIKTLRWAGIDFDEGPYLKMINGGGEKWELLEKGDFGPYVQSHRLDIYKEHARQLLEKGKAYYCFCTKERLEKMRQRQAANNKASMYDKLCRQLSQRDVAGELALKTPHVIRLKVPAEGSTKFKDIIRGEIAVENKLIDDQVLVKADGYPTYHLANIVDDHLMEITHVIRGEEWMPSTPKHILLYRVFGWKPPKFAHLPLLLNPDKSKLSKRQGDVAVEEYIERGYLPEALINFVALLGWNPKSDQEVYNLEQLVKKFNLKKVNKGGAVFNKEKLNWLDGYYIRQTSLDQLTKMCVPHLAKAGLIKIKAINFNYLKEVIALEQERMKILSEAGELTEFFFKEPNYEPKLLIWKKMETNWVLKRLNILQKFLTKIPEKSFKKGVLEKKIKDLIKKEDLGTGETLWPFRVALTGRRASPGPFEVACVLGKKKVLGRLKIAVKNLENEKKQKPKA